MKALKSVVNQVFLEESIYEIDSFSVDTTEFIQKLATAVKNVAIQEANTSGRYPGAFVVEVILVCSVKADASLREKLSEENAQKYRNYRDPLFNSEGDWRNNFFTISEKEKSKFHEETWEHFLEDLDIINIQWELPEGSVWVFVKKDTDSFFEIMISAQKEGGLESWKILAMRELLEKYEGDFVSLFENSDFLSSYAPLLRGIYMAYIPWYHRILLFLSINFFIDSAYRQAKLSIKREQSFYASANEARREKQKREQDEIKKASLEKIKDLSVVNKILEVMDYFYFDRKFVPNIHDVSERRGSTDMTELEIVLKKTKFQLLAPLNKENPWQNSILIYPKDHSWDIRKGSPQETC